MVVDLAGNFNGKKLTCDEKQLRKYLGILMDANGDRGCIELRIPETRRRTVIGYYTDHDQLAEACMKWADDGVPSVFCTFNPCKMDFLARAANRWQEYANFGTTDNDIAWRCWLPIDCDVRSKPKGTMATDAEQQTALAKMTTIKEELDNFGFPQPLVGSSGNGGHLMYRIDLPNTPEVTTILANFLRALSDKFSTPEVNVDSGVHNAARIWKVYGTPVRKGDEVCGRNHRVSSLISVPEQLEPVSINLLKAYIDINGSLKPAKVKQADGSWIENFIARHNIDVNLEKNDAQGRNVWRLASCPFCGESDKSAVITEDVDGKLGFKCQHNRCVDKTWNDLRQHFEPIRDVEADIAAAVSTMPGGAPIKKQTPPLMLDEPTFDDFTPKGSAAPAKRKRKGLDLVDLGTIPEPLWQIEEHFHQNTLVELVGAPGSGKSFVALDWLMSIASGRPYCGVFPVESGPVIYVCSEGASGIKRRVEAWQKHNGITIDRGRFVVIPESFNLLSEEEADEILEIAASVLGGPPVHLCIDTLNRNFGGGDENSPRDMGLFVATVEYLRNAINATTSIIHHTGKDAAKGGRGHSSLLGAVSTVIEVEKTPEGILVKTTKQKEANEKESYKLNKHIIDLGSDAKGNDVTSLAFSLVNQQLTRHSLLSKEMKDLLAILYERFHASTFSLAQAFLQFEKGLYSKTTFHRRLNQLVEKQMLAKVGLDYRIANDALIILQVM